MSECIMIRKISRIHSVTSGNSGTRGFTSDSSGCTVGRSSCRPLQAIYIQHNSTLGRLSFIGNVQSVILKWMPMLTGHCVSY